MRALGPVIGFLVLCGCVAPKPPVDPHHYGSTAGRYEARGHNWSLVITEDSVVLRDRVGEGHMEYVGAIPEAWDLDSGVRYEGELLRVYVVAGLVEEDVLPYVLTIRERPCVDEEGRVFPTSADWDFGPSAYRAVGCGGELPRADPRP